MHCELLGLIFHDSNLTLLCKIYKRNYINFIPFGRQRKVKVSGKVQLCGCVRQTAGIVYVTNFSSTQADSHSFTIMCSTSRAQHRSELFLHLTRLLNYHMQNFKSVVSPGGKDTVCGFGEHCAEREIGVKLY